MDFRNVTPPKSDQRPVWDIILWTIASRALTAAFQLKLFPLLDERPRTIDEISGALGIAPRGARAILSTCASVGLVRSEGDRWALCNVASEYLVEGKPTYFGRFLDFALVVNERLYALDTVRRAVESGKPQVYGGGELFKSHAEQEALMRGFTEMMHDHSIATALVWPEKIDLSSARTFLDVGGGSGAHSIGVVRRWPNLRATVFEVAPVCPVAREFAARYGFAERISIHAGDMWTDPFPAADVHFYSEIFHDWSPEKCLFLARKSFAALPAGGRILLHEMVFDDDEGGPFATAAYSVAMLLWTEGQQFSARDLGNLLREAGFRDVETRPTFAYHSVVSARKP